ncbi:Progestin and adipoQ receptor member 3 [Irineochytrium annulatum]|nr:Progestin and adipoQ receptor member 3 [Irineochytrium annulatum]
MNTSLTRKLQDAPRYLQDNPFIFSGYRSGYTYVENWISLWHLHNETFNVWTHIAGALLFASIAVFYALGWGHTDVPIAGWADRLVLVTFAASSVITFGASSLYHLHMSHSEEAYRVYGCWDYSGISASVFGNSLSLTYHLFYCDRLSFLLWLLPISLTNTLGVFGPSLFPFWARGSFRPYRTALYVISALVSMAPIPHYFLFAGGSTLQGIRDEVAEAAFRRYAAGLGVYAFGIFIYIGKLPERVFPGRFDIFFQSHQIWHVACVAAALVHLYVVFDFMEWRSQTQCVK